MPPRLIYIFNAISMKKNPGCHFFFTGINKKRPRIAKTVLENNNKFVRFIATYVKTYCVATAIMTVWHWPKDKYVDPME